LASKKYISPIRLLLHADVDVNAELNISRIKKQLAAEFAMANDGFITIEAFVYNKQDVLDELENEDFINRHFYHKKIWNSQFILSMLENNEANYNEVKAELNNFQHDEKFDEFFSPYFAEPFNYVVKQCIDNNQLQDAGNWLAFESFILHNEREAAFKSLRIFLDESEKTFNNVNGDNFKVFQPKLLPWLNYGWYTLLNNLPNELYQYKHSLVVDLINLTVSLEKKHTQYCKIVSNGLIEIKDLAPNLRETIINNNNVFNGKAKNGENNYWWVLWVIFILLRILSTGGCN
jgi:hypothetical protein